MVWWLDSSPESLLQRVRPVLPEIKLETERRQILVHEMAKDLHGAVFAG